MNKLVKGKKTLVGISIALIGLCLLLVAGSIGLIVWGASIVKSSVALGVVLIIVGVLLSIMFLGGVVYSFIFYFTGKSLVALTGSVAEDNLGIGTVNMNKCNNCGTKIENNEKFCAKCDSSLEDAKKCEKCGVLNKLDANNCTACGEKLK